MEFKPLHKRLFGLLTSLVLASALLYIFYGALLKDPNNVYFAKDNDGMQNYYGHVYHLKYDTTYLRTAGMNYPYGEMVYYTGIQLVPASVLKFVSHYFPAVSDNMIGIQNMLMLSSIVLAALLLFLILFELGVAWGYAAVSATAIAYLSPQLDRFGGHFSLTYVFSVPLIIYLIMLFYRKRTFVLSAIICFTSFWAFTTHPYLFGMNEALLLFFWIYIFFNERTKWKTNAWHFLIQFILAYIFIQILASVSDSVTDRTDAPWGFLYYRAFPEGVFLPFGKPYGTFLYSIFTKTDYLQWEGIAYVGLVGVFAFGMVLSRWYKSVSAKQYAAILAPTDNALLNAIFWGSFAALLYSFGIPFILGLQFLVDYSGPLKQMRGIGRFTWPFFYTINIVGVYMLWSYLKKVRYTYLIALPVLMLCYDAYINVHGREGYYNNRFAELEDSRNMTNVNAWTKSIDASKYQALIPIPYYHLGSENIWLTPTCSSLATSLMISMKTGIPTTGIYYSRTSISQSYNNLALVLEPYRKPKILDAYKNTKPLLLVDYHCDTYTVGESNLKNMASLIFKGDYFSLYEIQFHTLEHMADSLYSNALQQYSHMKLTASNGVSSSNPTVDYVYKSFDTLVNIDAAYIGNGCFTSGTKGMQLLFEDTIPAYDTTKTYTASFWFGNILTDKYLRTDVINAVIDSIGVGYNENWAGAFKYVKIIDNNWALLEFPIKLNHPKEKLKIVLSTSLLKNKMFVVDELLIKPDATTIFKKEDKGLVKNNRLFLRGQ